MLDKASLALYISWASAIFAGIAALIAERIRKETKDHHKLSVVPNLIIEGAFVSAENDLSRLKMVG